MTSNATTRRYWRLEWLHKRAIPREELWRVFIVCTFPVHVWSIIFFLRKVPVYLLRMNLFGIISIFAYVQVFALLESLFIFSILVILGMILPVDKLRDQFAERCTLIVLITALWSIPLHFAPQIVQRLSLGLYSFIFSIWLWVITYLVVMGLAFYLLHRNPIFKARISAFIERLSILSYLYLTADLFCILLVLYRNLF